MISIRCHSDINTVCSWLGSFLSVPIHTAPCSSLGAATFEFTGPAGLILPPCLAFLSGGLRNPISAPCFNCGQ